MAAKFGGSPAGIPGIPPAPLAEEGVVDTSLFSWTFCFAAARDCLMDGLFGSYEQHKFTLE